MQSCKEGYCKSNPGQCRLRWFLSTGCRRIVDSISDVLCSSQSLPRCLFVSAKRHSQEPGCCSQPLNPNKRCSIFQCVWFTWRFVDNHNGAVHKHGDVTLGLTTLWLNFRVLHFILLYGVPCNLCVTVSYQSIYIAHMMRYVQAICDISDKKEKKCENGTVSR